MLIETAKRGLSSIYACRCVHFYPALQGWLQVKFTQSTRCLGWYDAKVKIPHFVTVYLGFQIVYYYLPVESAITISLRFPMFGCYNERGTNGLSQYLRKHNPRSDRKTRKSPGIESACFDISPRGSFS